MRSHGLKFVAGACVAMSAGVFVNVLFLQKKDVPRDGHSHSQAAAPAPSAARDSDRTRAAAATDVSGFANAQAPTQPSRRLVRAVQRELGLRKYFEGRADGHLDLTTRAAILAYETDHELRRTAHVSEALLQSILLGKTGQSSDRNTAAGPSALELVRLVQRLLNRSGYSEVRMTGQMDAATSAAIAAFERRNRLEPKGRISARLVYLLQLHPGRKRRG